MQHLCLILGFTIFYSIHTRTRPITTIDVLKDPYFTHNTNTHSYLIKDERFRLNGQDS